MQKTPVVLQTDRLILQPFVEEDLPDLVRYHTNPSVQTGYDPNGQPWSEVEIAKRLRSYISALEELGFSRWKVTQKNGVFVGRASLWWYEPEKSVELGYGFLPEYWGRGYAREVSTALISWGFENLAIEKIVAHTYIHNLRSQKILAAQGMTYVEDRCRSEYDGMCAYFELQREDVPNGNNAIVGAPTMV